MWIGNKSHFITKGGMIIEPPKFVINQLPNDLNLDGELWQVKLKKFISFKLNFSTRIDRGRADEVKTLVYRPSDCGPESWKDIKFMIFDCPPSSSSSTEPFEQRIGRLSERLAQDLKQKQLLWNIEVIKMEKCTGFDHLYSFLSEILEKVESIIRGRRFNLASREVKV